MKNRIAVVLVLACIGCDAASVPPLPPEIAEKIDGGSAEGWGFTLTLEELAEGHWDIDGSYTCTRGPFDRTPLSAVTCARPLYPRAICEADGAIFPSRYEGECVAADAPLWAGRWGGNSATADPPDAPQK